MIDFIALRSGQGPPGVARVSRARNVVGVRIHGEWHHLMGGLRKLSVVGASNDAQKGPVAAII